MTPNSPTVDGKALPTHPWDPAAPALSSGVPLLIGYAHTEETLYDRPTPESMALDEAGLKQRVARRLGVDPAPVIEAFRAANPQATPWDLYILIATDHPRGTYTRELARRKAAQAGAPAFVYRFDWETPEGGGHMRSPHTIEIPFVFNNIKIAGPLISKMPEAYALADKVSSAWVAFARTGDPEHPEAAEVAELLGQDARHDAVQQRQPGRAGSGSRGAVGDGARAKDRPRGLGGGVGVYCGVLAVNQERYRLNNTRQLSYRGVKFYDVSDPAHPKFLWYWEAPTSPPNPTTGVYPDMRGTHHFNFDGRYLYLGTDTAATSA